jgi:hypothetical protein
VHVRTKTELSWIENLAWYFSCLNKGHNQPEELTFSTQSALSSNYGAAKFYGGLVHFEHAPGAIQHKAAR